MNPRVQLKVPEDSTIGDLAVHLAGKWDKCLDVSAGLQLFLIPQNSTDTNQDMALDPNLVLKNLVSSVPRCFSGGAVLLHYDLASAGTSVSTIASPPSSPPVTPSHPLEGKGGPRSSLNWSLPVTPATTTTVTPLSFDEAPRATPPLYTAPAAPAYTAPAAPACTAPAQPAYTAPAAPAYTAPAAAPLPADNSVLEKLLDRQESFFRSLLADQNRFFTEVIDRLMSKTPTTVQPKVSNKPACESCDRGLDIPDKSASLILRLEEPKLCCSSFHGCDCSVEIPFGTELGEGFIVSIVESLASQGDDGSVSFSDVSAVLQEKDGAWLLNGKRLSTVLHGLKPPQWKFDGEFVIVTNKSKAKRVRISQPRK